MYIIVKQFNSLQRLLRTIFANWQI